MRGRQSGFTLIELITVIVILGILAAVALPRFSGLERQARIASLQGLAGAMKSAAALARAQWLAEGATSGGTTITMEGQSVSVDTFGYPTQDAAGIGTALNIDTGAGGDYNDEGGGVYSIPGRGDCEVRYQTFGTVQFPDVSVVPGTGANGC